MPLTRTLTAAAVVLLAGAPARAVAQANVAFDAVLAKAVPKPHPPFTAGGVSFTCTTSKCMANGSPRDPASVCKAVKQMVGALSAFVAGGHAYNVSTCAPIAAMQAAPTTAVHVPTARPLPPPVPVAPPAATPAAKPAPPKKSGTAPATGVAFTAQAIQLTGTGVAAPHAPFTPVAWTADAIALTGSGTAAPARAPLGVAITADTIRLTGHP